MNFLRSWFGVLLVSLASWVSRVEVRDLTFYIGLILLFGGLTLGLDVPVAMVVIGTILLYLSMRR